MLKIILDGLTKRFLKYLLEQQVPGRLFSGSDSGLRRSSRISGEGTTNTNSNVPQGGNGSNHSSSKFLGGISLSSSKMNLISSRSTTNRKNKLWASENFDEGDYWAHFKKNFTLVVLTLMELITSIRFWNKIVQEFKKNQSQLSISFEYLQWYFIVIPLSPSIFETFLMKMSWLWSMVRSLVKNSISTLPISRKKYNNTPKTHMKGRKEEKNWVFFDQISC